MDRNDLLLLRPIHPKRDDLQRQVSAGYWISNVALAFFFAALVAAGVVRGVFPGETFQMTMVSMRPFMVVFAVSGIALMIGLWIVIWNAWRLTGLIGKPMTEDGALPEPA